jgi:hypothetical protein
MALRRTPRVECTAPLPEAVTLPAGAKMGIVPLEHRASNDIDNQ